MTKAERKEAWIDQIKTAKYMAKETLNLHPKEYKSTPERVKIYTRKKILINEAIEENPSDGGTCNFDEAMIKKEKWFTYAEIIAIFNECGLSASKHKAGWLLVGGLHGQAEKNTLWAKTFAFWLDEQGFETSMYYQMD